MLQNSFRECFRYFWKGSLVIGVIEFFNPKLIEEYERLIYSFVLFFALKERNSELKTKHIWESYSHYYRM